MVKQEFEAIKGYFESHRDLPAHFIQVLIDRLDKVYEEPTEPVTLEPVKPKKKVVKSETE